MVNVQALQQEYGFRAEDVAGVDVRAPRVHLRNLMYECPETGLQGKFSLEYGLACILVSGDCVLADFTDEAVRRESHRRLYPRLHRHAVDKLEGECPTEVHVTLVGGRKLERSIEMPLGSNAAPFAMEQYWQKLEHCAYPLLESQRYTQVRQCLEDFRSRGCFAELSGLLAVDLPPIGDQ